VDRQGKKKREEEKFIYLFIYSKAILGGADKMLFGFVTRVRTKDNNLHAVLSTQSYKTMEFARQISLRASNAFGILKELIERIRELGDFTGNLVLLRDPNKAQVRIYRVPEGETFKKEIPQ
jgi:hypothetical protein